MIKGLSPRAQRLIVALAPDEAYKLGSKELEPEHVMLALLKSGDGLGYFALKALHINVLTMQLAIEQSLPAHEPSSDLSELPHSPRLKQLLDTASAEAKNLRVDFIGTEHILLASIREEQSLTSNYFKKAGIPLDRVRLVVSEVEKKIPSSAHADGNDSFQRFVPPQLNQVPFMSDGTAQQQKRSQGNSILEQFCRDITLEAAEGHLDPVVGRSREIQRVIQILSRRTKNNPVLVGEPGVGKTAIVEGLAQMIVRAKVPGDLTKKHILCLDLAAMIAGTKYRGEFEERMKRLMKELKERKDVIIFIDELHTIIGAGGPEGSMDASNMMKPALSRGEIQVIGATTTKEYRKYFEKDSALVRRFQMVSVDQPSEKDTEEILRGLKERYEEFHHVTYDEDVIPAIVTYSSRYINERFLPDKAIDILDEAGAAKKIQGDVRPEELEKLDKSIWELSEEKRSLVAEQDYEQAALVRDRVHELMKRFDEVNLNWKQSRTIRKARVTVDDVCSIISTMTGIPVEQLDDGETKRLLNMEEVLHREVVGQDEAVSLISSAVRRSRAGVSSHKRPMGSFIFLGPTGVGKTQLAKTLAKFLFGTEDALIRVDMSDYMEKQNASRLVGSPPGYVGYEEGGLLTEKVRQKPYSVVLLDEIEKAHPDVFNLLLQMLEEGELSDNLGHTVSFRNCIVIMTSNAGAREIVSEGRMGFATSSNSSPDFSDIRASAMEELKKLMSPELLNRIDDVIVFNTLSREQVSAILSIQLGELETRLAEQELNLLVKPAAREYFVEHGYDPAMGARPMRRLIQRELEDSIATLILQGKKVPGSTLVVDYKDEKLCVKFKKSTRQPHLQTAPVPEETELVTSPF